MRKGQARRSALLLMAAGIIPGVLVAAPGTAHAESYGTWAITQAEACAMPYVQDIPPITVQGLISEAYVMHTAAATSCASLNKPVQDTTDVANSAAEVALASANSASPNDIIDILAGVVTLQASSLADFQYMVGVNATDPNVYLGVQSNMLGLGSGYMVGVDTAGGAESVTYLPQVSAAGCLSGACDITLASLRQQSDEGPGSEGNGGNSPNRMTAFKSFPITWDPAKNHHRVDGYGNYFYFNTEYKYRSDVDFYATSMWSSAQKYGDNRMKKVYMAAVPGKSMQVVDADPRGVSRNGDSIGSTTINADFKGEVKGGNDKGSVSGGAGIGISRTYNRYEGSGGGSVLHDGTHYTTWIAGNRAGTTTARSVDGVTSWSVPTNTAADWGWQAYVTTCSNPC
jgi:hypothetical protein